MIDDKLTRAMNALHDIGSAYDARRYLADADAGTRTFTEPLRKSIRAKALTDDQIDKLAMDTWEELATELAMTAAPGVRDDLRQINPNRDDRMGEALSRGASDAELEAILQDRPVVKHRLYCGPPSRERGAIIGTCTVCWQTGVGQHDACPGPKAVEFTEEVRAELENFVVKYVKDVGEWRDWVRDGYLGDLAPAIQTALAVIDRTVDNWARALDETKAEKNSAVIQLSNAKDTIGGMRTALEGKDKAIHTLAQGFEDLLLVATTDTDDEGFITAYHFNTGALHRLLAIARQLCPYTDQRPLRGPTREVPVDKPWGIRGGRHNEWVTHSVPMAFTAEDEAQELADSFDTKEGRWSFTAERFTPVADDGWPADLTGVDVTGAPPHVLRRASEQAGEKLAGVHAPIAVGALGPLKPGEVRAPAVWPTELRWGVFYLGHSDKVSSTNLVIAAVKPVRIDTTPVDFKTEGEATAEAERLTEKSRNRGQPAHSVFKAIQLPVGEEATR